MRNTLAGGRQLLFALTLGVVRSAVVQGVAAAAGPGAVVPRVEPLFQAVKWVGIGYLLRLGAQSFRSATAGRYAPLDGGAEGRGSGQALVFYLAVLPQFLGRHSPVGALLLFALSHAVLGLLYLLFLVGAVHRARRVLSRRTVRRALDAATGTALIGFGVRLAAEHA